MKVLVTQVGQFTKEFEVNGSDKVNVVLDQLQKGNHLRSSNSSQTVLLYRGIKLSPDTTFTQAKIQDNEFILAVTATIRLENVAQAKRNAPVVAPPASLPQQQDNSNVRNAVELFMEAYAAANNNAAAPNAAAPPVAVNNPLPTPAPVINNNEQNIRNNAAPHPEVVQEVESSINILIDAGFSHERSKKALLINRCDVEAALNWLLEHIEDPDIDTPLSADEIARLTSSASQEITEDIRDCIANQLCTLTLTGETYCSQELFECNTCGLVGGKGCCEACANKCHAGHNVVSVGVMSGYCDCGSGSSCSAKLQ